MLVSWITCPIRAVFGVWAAAAERALVTDCSLLPDGCLLIEPSLNGGALPSPRLPAQFRVGRRNGPAGELVNQLDADAEQSGHVRLGQRGGFDVPSQRGGF